MALNTSDNDLAMQLHFALFDGAAGFVLKPPVMCGVQQTMMEHRLPEDVEYWPAPGRQLHRTSIKFLSIHLLSQGALAKSSHTNMYQAAQRGVGTEKTPFVHPLAAWRAATSLQRNVP